MLQRTVLLFGLVFFSACASMKTTQEPTTPRTPAQISDLYLEMGTSALSNADYPRAIENLRIALKHNSENKVAYNHLGLAMMGMNQREDAKSQFARALGIDPNYSDALVNLGTWHFNANDFVTARHYYNKALKNLEYGRRFLPLTSLGHIALLENRLEDAKKFLYEALSHNPKYCLTHMFLGTIYLRENRPEKALAEYKNSVKGTCAGNIEGQFQLGVVHERLQQFREARAQFQQVIEISPNTELAEEASRKLRAIP